MIPLLTIFTTNVWSADVTYTLSSASGNPGSGNDWYSGTIDSYTSWAATNGGSNHPKYYSTGSGLRVYSGGTFTITSSKTIASIKFTFSSSSYTFRGDISTSPYTVTPNATSWSVSVNRAHCRLQKIEITYAVSGYKITYHCNGATSGCPSDASGQTALPNPLPSAPTKAGSTFGGWYTNSTLTTAAVAGASLSADADLYAKWTCNVTLNRNGATETINNVTEGTTLNSIDGDGDQGGCSAWTFVGWSKTQRAAQNVSTAMTLVTTVDGAGPYYAVYSHTEGGGGSSDVTDEITDADLAATSNTYTAFTDVAGANSDAVYAGQSTKNSGIGLRGTNPAGIVSSTSGGKIKSVVIDWGSNATNSRYIDVYGNNSAYSTAADLYNTSTDGDKVGTITYTSSSDYTTTYNFEDDYDYVGIRVRSSATVIASVSFTWTTSGGGTTYYSTTATCCTELAAINGSVSSTTQNSATLQWDKLSNVDGTTPYTVSCKVTSSGSAAGSVGSIDLSGAKATCTITSLTGGIGYTFTITAHGASGYCDKEQVLTATTPTCTDWSTPTVSYSSSLAINASEGVTIGSGTTHGAVTYESSDDDVLTVAADGTIHAVGAGTAHITATWDGDATYCEKSANSNDVTVSGIQVTGTTPVNFGQVYQGALIGTKTIYVTGLGLTNDITPSLPVGSPFSFSPASLAANSSNATLTISASTATIGDYNQTLTLTSGAFSATVTVKMEVIAKPTATFTDALHNLTEDKDGVSLSSYNLTAAQGTPVVFPTLANQTKSAGTCEGEYYIFAGWTEGNNNTNPEDHLVTSYTLANGDTKNYYAVWADASGSATYTKLTSDAFSGSPAKYVLGAEHEGTTYYFSDYDPDNIAYNLSWGTCSSSDAPIQFTLSGTASALVAKDNLNNYLEAPCTTKAFYISGSETSVELKSNGTVYNNGDGCTSYRLRYNYNSGSGGLRWYTSDTGDPAYFYLVGTAGTVHYRTSCCTNKVDAPVVTASTVTSTSITLTWPSDVKATGWQIEWNGAGGWVTPSGSCTHTVSGLTPNTTYTWRVRATYEDPVCGADVRSGSTTTNQVYHVTYAKGSGTGTCTATNSTTDATGYEAGATVTLQENEFKLVGHDFAGWTEDDDDITISSNQFTMPDHDVVITATWTAKADKYFDRMHDQTDASHGGVAETEGTNEGKYYILKEGCSYSVPTAVDSKTGDACQTSHYKLRGWIAASYVNSKGEITDESKIFSPGTTKTAGGYTYYAVWAEVVE